MRKIVFFIVMVAIMLIAVLLSTTIVYGDVKVGDPIPKLDSYTDMGGEYYIAGGAKETPKEVYFVWFQKEGETPRYQKAYLVCKGEIAKFPFGIFDKQTKTLYLDNNPNDGLIDEIVDAKYRRLYPDIPDCK